MYNMYRLWEIVNKVLPTVYDDTLSYYEVLTKVCNAIRELAQQIDDIDTDIKSQIDDYINSPEFTEFVKQIVSGMVSETDISPRSNDLDVHRIFSKLEKSSIKYPQEAHYNVPQSICYTGNNRLIVCWGLEGDANITGAIKIVEYSLPDMSVIRSNIVSVGHANGCTYDTAHNRLYICGLDSLTVGGVTGYGIHTVNYNDLTVGDSYLFDFNPTGCAMDNDTGVLYLSSGTGAVFAVDTSTMAVIRGFDIQLPQAHGTIYQDIEYHDGLLYYVLWRPNTICVFDLTGKFVRLYNVPKWWDKIYRCFECEGLAYIGDGNFVISSYGNAEPSHYTGEGSLGMINFDKNTVNHPSAMLNYHSFNATYDIYVDASDANTGNINPVGTKGSPFRSLQEAFSSARSPYFDGLVTIHTLAGAEPYPLSVMGVNKQIIITGNSYTVGNVAISNCQYININANITFTPTESRTGTMEVSRSAVELTNAAFTTDNTTYDIYAKVSDVRMSYTTTTAPSVGLVNSNLHTNRTHDTSNVTLLDSVSDCTRPITVTTGTFTATFNTRFDVRNMSYVTLGIVAGEWTHTVDIATVVTPNQLVHINYISAGSTYDLYFNLNFNTANTVTIFNANYKVDGGETQTGFPSGAYIASVAVHN